MKRGEGGNIKTKDYGSSSNSDSSSSSDHCNLGIKKMPYSVLVTNLPLYYNFIAYFHRPPPPPPPPLPPILGVDGGLAPGKFFSL